MANDNYKDSIIKKTNNNKNKFTQEEIRQYVRELVCYFADFDDNNWYDVYEPIDKVGVIEGFVEWGDEIRNHKDFKDKVIDFFKDKYINIDIKEEVVERDEDSNYYSAIYYITKKVD